MRRFLCPALVVLMVIAGCRPRAVAVADGARTPSFRVAVWNVAESSFVRRPEAFRRILQEADADVYSFDEVGEQTTREQLLATLRGLRGGADTVWHLSWGAGGDYQRTVIAARTPLEPVPEFAPLAYPAGTELVMARAPDSLRAALARDFTRGVATNAAVATVRGRRLLIVGLDLWARGNSVESWEEARRRVEAGAVRDGVQRAVARLASERNGVHGIVIGGDMNLVAGRAPLDTVLALGAGSFARLTLAQAIHRDGWSTWTWDGRGGPFHSARMDVLLFSEQTLRAVGARVVDWDVFPAVERASLRLTPAPVVGFSRHRPVVVALEWR